jgi:ppGpp synthetase/RelA/SpoT-type nucleotidyltranferase
MTVANHLIPEKLEEAGITLEELKAIQQDFLSKAASYEQDALYTTNLFLKAPGVHSVRYRVKDSEHLIEKIVRKRLERKDRLITIETYEQELTDLAGVRVLHLFKGDWQHIHNYILGTWDLKEKPTAYYRQGDAAEILTMFGELNCEVKQHPAGYRSVHYIIDTSPTKVKRHLEIQVRTIFEEGWSEVDHKIRYPNFSNNPLTNSLLLMLNRLAGSADEMSSFVQELSAYIINSESEFKQLEAEKNEQIQKLEAVIQNPTTSQEAKVALESVAESITNSTHSNRTMQDIITRISNAGFPTNTLSDLLNSNYRDPLEGLPGAAILKSLDQMYPKSLANFPNIPGIIS